MNARTLPAMPIAPGFSDAERQAALCRGAAVLRARGGRAWLQAVRQLQPVGAEVAMVLPGVVRVVVRDTGELIAQSVPGALEVMEPDRTRWGLEGLALEVSGVLGKDLVHAATLMSPAHGLSIAADYASAGPAWPGPDGVSLADAVGEWLAEHRAEFPELQGAAAAAEVGRCCGLYVPASPGQPARYLVAHAAMAACLAGLGLPAATMAELHDSLAELARDGLCEPRPVAQQLPGLGLVWCYVLAATLAD